MLQDLAVPLLAARKGEEYGSILEQWHNGAEDLEDLGEIWQVTCEPGDVNSLREALEAAGLEVEESDTTMMPTNTVPLADVSQVKMILNLVEILDDSDDVQDVHSNVDIDDEVLNALG